MIEYVLCNVVVLIVMIIGVLIIMLILGVVVIESVFNIFGFGCLMLEVVLVCDYMVI